MLFVKEQGAVSVESKLWNEEQRRTLGSKREVYESSERAESEGQA